MVYREGGWEVWQFCSIDCETFRLAHRLALPSFSSVPGTITCKQNIGGIDYIQEGRL